MALSLSPQQLNQVMHTPSIPNQPLPLQSYSSTPKQLELTQVPVAHNRSDHQETFSLDKTESLLALGSDLSAMHEARAPKSVILPDLPTWTPLKPLRAGSIVPDSEPEEDGQNMTGNKRPRGSPGPTYAQNTVNKDVTVKPALKPPSYEAQPSKLKKARFDGVLITTKAPQDYRSKHVSLRRPLHTSASTQAMSLVDALARTFDANRYIEAPLVRRPRGADRHPQTDVETTDVEDEQREFNARLAHKPSSRRLLGTKAIPHSADASETQSQRTTPSRLDVPQAELRVKRLKPIPYDVNATLIDAALGTVEAPVSWDAELDFITGDGEFTICSVRTTPAVSADDYMSVGPPEGNSTANSRNHTLGKASEPPSAAHAKDAWQVPNPPAARQAVLRPYLSRKAQFEQRLNALFGENTVVRTDKTARPKRVDLEDFFAPFDQLDRAPSPNPSESTASISAASTTEEVPSAIPSTHITSQSPDIPSADIHTDRLPGSQAGDMGAVTDTTFVFNTEQMNGWIVALQRLVKGKVRVSDEDLEKLSIIVAEIESLKDRLRNDSTTSELRESIKQLSELHEIPYGDRNRLRKRAEDIVQTWPSSMMESGTF